MSTTFPTLPYSLAALTIVLALWSGIAPFDRLTWYLEAAPAFIGLGVLVFTFRRFPLTPLAYTLIFLHMAVLFIGGHYTYERVPAFTWLKDACHLSRNHFDRVGHFMQGFCPAIIAREILMRRGVVRGRGWLAFLVICFALALSAMYELIEWQTALILGSGADDFLAVQGDQWDTQTDMFLCLFGALCALALLSRLHDRQIDRLSGTR